AQPPEGILSTGSGRGPHLLGGVLDGFAECDVIRGRWNARFGGAGFQMAAERFQIREHFAGAAVASGSILGERAVDDALKLDWDFIRKLDRKSTRLNSSH